MVTGPLPAETRHCGSRNRAPFTTVPGPAVTLALAATITIGRPIEPEISRSIWPEAAEAGPMINRKTPDPEPTESVRINLEPAVVEQNTAALDDRVSDPSCPCPKSPTSREYIPEA